MTGPADAAEEVDIRPMLTPAGTASWLGVHELAERVGVDSWAIAGGQMVSIHAARHRLDRFRPTTDADMTVDVRTRHGRRAMRDVAETLVTLGFTVEASPDGVSSFRRGEARIDLLAPEGLSGIIETVAGGRAVQAPGGTQALRRSGPMSVTWSGITTVVRCPNLLGALVAKAAAATEIHESARRRLRHQQDFVLLAGLMTVEGFDPSEIERKDRLRLHAAWRPLAADPVHPAWAEAVNVTDVEALVSELLGS